MTGPIDRINTRTIGFCPVTGKCCYTDKRSAKRIARTKGKKTHPYRCPHCDFWHNGSLGDKDRAWHQAHHNGGQTHE